MKTNSLYERNGRCQSTPIREEIGEKNATAIFSFNFLSAFSKCGKPLHVLIHDDGVFPCVITSLSSQQVYTLSAIKRATFWSLFCLVLSWISWQFTASIALPSPDAVDSIKPFFFLLSIEIFFNSYIRLSKRRLALKSATLWPFLFDRISWQFTASIALRSPGVVDSIKPFFIYQLCSINWVKEIWWILKSPEESPRMTKNW